MQSADGLCHLVADAAPQGAQPDCSPAEPFRSRLAPRLGVHLHWNRTGLHVKARRVSFMGDSSGLPVPSTLCLRRHIPYPSPHP